MSMTLAAPQPPGAPDPCFKDIVMANIQRLLTQYKNRIADSLGESGRTDVGDGYTLT